jgi:hypothetical protein
MNRLVRWQAERLDTVLLPGLERDRDELSEVLRGFALELQRLLLVELDQHPPRELAGARLNRRPALQLLHHAAGEIGVPV